LPESFTKQLVRVDVKNGYGAQNFLLRSDHSARFFIVAPVSDAHLIA